MDLSEPQTGPSIQRLSWWRQLPLTAQLGVVGMIVTLAWFLTARLAADRVEAEAHARNEELQRLHAIEVSATRMLTSIMTMSAAQRAFVITGEEERGVQYEQARRVYSGDLNGLREFVRTDQRVVSDFRRIEEIVERWDREVVARNFAIRRATGEHAFESGAGARNLSRGIAMIDTVRALHNNMLRNLREAVIELEADAERSAALNEWETFLIRAAALAIFLLLLTLMMRVVARALRQVVVAAEALDAGRYQDARLPNVRFAPNREMARLAFTFERLAQSIAMRERQLQEDIEQLKELERLKTDFVSTVSHELRTPLTSMRGALGLLLGGTVGEMPVKGRELLRIALSNCERLIRLINDILDIEKMDAGHVTLKQSRLRLGSLLETTVAGLEGLARDASVRLEILPGEEVTVLGDADRLIQVLTNLGSNAVKFSPKGSAVEFSMTREGERVLIGVRDHGPGIPPEFASRIFGRFQQAGGAESRKSGGTGLGLSIAKGITELHGGQIGFKNAEDGGTIFWVALPVAPAEISVGTERPAVLIVEDDDSMRAVLSALIEPFAMPITVADAESAIQALATEPVKIVVLDHGLPDIDGLALTRALRADNRFRSTTILLYSAQEFDPDELRAAGIRVTDAFVKTRDTEASLLDRIKKELLAHR